MRIVSTTIRDIYEVYTEPLVDERGIFTRTYDYQLIHEKCDFTIVQMSRSITNLKGTLRGMHFQNEPDQEIKLVECLQGEIFDVVVDLRKDSSTYLQYLAWELSPKKNISLLIPKGCAHGFITLSNSAVVQYAMDTYYNPSASSGVRWDDPALNISWPILPKIISAKDATWKLIKQR